MTALEMGMYELGRLFLVPVLVIIMALFAYAFYALGAFALEAWQRRRATAPCPLQHYQARAGKADSEELELVILRQLEPLRVVSRTAPMLGLVATMIPLGPALLALGDGDLATVGEQLVVAFAAVILALITASITFWVLTVRRRWLLAALKRLEQQGGTA
ncbi:MotA/TolQ/ExbB proton channel family protein [Aquisalimonas asiatica]|uniref:Outer membrane transport energization protein ExbB (TC 2.C.1.1.1) n=1 Tax=Aquisalimonas asiatica TaxID=406100 RepID=A0A1H8SWP8_9GAMM|nr:MotA/TolQ/ExbB proton channel family protein [Aquisalimonas asiatica]SEO83092.1 outer membrane transport energization protein ExbB (TC 2.C.1.1.1) [Aquisalimonas asiatica]